MEGISNFHQGLVSYWEQIFDNLRHIRKTLFGSVAIYRTSNTSYSHISTLSVKLVLHQIEYLETRSVIKSFRENSWARSEKNELRTSGDLFHSQFESHRPDLSKLVAYLYNVLTNWTSIWIVEIIRIQQRVPHVAGTCTSVILICVVSTGSNILTRCIFRCFIIRGSDQRVRLDPPEMFHRPFAVQIVGK